MYQNSPTSDCNPASETNAFVFGLKKWYPNHYILAN